MAKTLDGSCSFCGKSRKDATLLITGLTGAICDDCVMQAYDIVREAKPKSQGFMPKGEDIPKPQELKAFLDQYVIGQDTAKRYLSVAVYNHYAKSDAGRCGN